MEKFSSIAGAIQSSLVIGISSFIFCVFLSGALLNDRAFLENIYNNSLIFILHGVMIYVSSINLKQKILRFHLGALFVVIEMFFFSGYYVFFCIPAVAMEIKLRGKEENIENILYAYADFLNSLASGVEEIISMVLEEKDFLYDFLFGWPLIIFSTWNIIYLLRVRYKWKNI